VNTYLNQNAEEMIAEDIELRRATAEEKDGQITNVRGLQKENAAKIEESLAKLKKVAMDGGNIFTQMMETARYASLGQISQALYKVGGQYRRNM
jgi:methylmalonyl-CoA mutase